MLSIECFRKEWVPVLPLAFLASPTSELMDARPRILRYLGTIAAGIFAGSSLALNFGQIQALYDTSVSPKAMVNQFRVWHSHQSGYAALQ
jgi:hypothetical protein